MLRQMDIMALLINSEATLYTLFYPTDPHELNTDSNVRS